MTLDSAKLDSPPASYGVLLKSDGLVIDPQELGVQFDRI